MGYTTEFTGSFETDKPVDNETFDLINGLAGTRRVKRSGLDAKYGIDGEFYWETDGNYGQNESPSTQPGPWLQWEMTDRQTIEWDGGEKFYYYVEWLEYLIDKILKPKGYIINGEVEWAGEEQGDLGLIIVVNNVVTIKKGYIEYK